MKINDITISPAHCTVKSATFGSGTPINVVIDNVKQVTINFSEVTSVDPLLDFTVSIPRGGTATFQFNQSIAPTDYYAINKWDCVRIESGPGSPLTTMHDIYLYGCTKLAEAMSVESVGKDAWVLSGVLVISFQYTDNMPSGTSSNASRHWYF
jgi:hypothetical protein